MDLLMNNVFSVVKGDKTYSFVVPQGAPYGEAIDSCFEILTKLSDMQKEAIDSMKKETSSVDAPATPVDAEVISA